MSATNPVWALSSNTLKKQLLLILHTEPVMTVFSPFLLWCTEKNKTSEQFDFLLETNAAWKEDNHHWFPDMDISRKITEATRTVWQVPSFCIKHKEGA